MKNITGIITKARKTGEFYYIGITDSEAIVDCQGIGCWAATTKERAIARANETLNAKGYNITNVIDSKRIMFENL